MKKKYMYSCVVISPYGVKTKYFCASKQNLINFINQDVYRDFEKHDIFLSNHYTTDGNTEVWAMSLN